MENADAIAEPRELLWRSFQGGKTKDLMTFGAYDGVASYVIVLKGNEGFVATYCLLRDHKDRAKVKALPRPFQTLLEAKEALQDVANRLQREHTMRQGCFNCLFMRVEPDAIGRTYIRSRHPYPCTWTAPDIKFPTSITDHPTLKMNWPPLRRMVTAADGANCPAWKHHPER